MFLHVPMRIASFGLVFCLFGIATVTEAQKLNVVIVDRQTSDQNYSYVVPGHLLLRSTSSASVFGTGNPATGTATSTTTGSAMPPVQVSYDVRGATFTLRLPDGRLVIVNCESKYAPRGDFINRRSCRMPLVNEIQAEFKGDKAKLFWPVSIDGKKSESETYKILGILTP